MTGLNLYITVHPVLVARDGMHLQVVGSTYLCGFGSRKD